MGIIHGHMYGTLDSNNIQKRLFASFSVAHPLLYNPVEPHLLASLPLHIRPSIPVPLLTPRLRDGNPVPYQALPAPRILAPAI